VQTGVVVAAQTDNLITDKPGDRSRSFASVPYKSELMPRQFVRTVLDAGELREEVDCFPKPAAAHSAHQFDSVAPQSARKTPPVPVLAPREGCGI